MTVRLFIVGLLIALFLGALGVFHFVIKPDLIRTQMQKRTPPVQTVTVEPARLERVVERVNAIGTTYAIMGVEIASQEPGTVTDIHFDSGNTVNKGARLVQLDTAVERADLESNLATLKQAELDLRRQRQLERRGVAAEAKLDSAIAARDSAEAAVKRVRAQIARKSITAPFDGVLGIRKVDIGQYVSPGLPLVTLQSLDPIHVDFPVPERQIGMLRDGQAIDVTVAAYPGKTFCGTIVALDARVSQETRTLQVRGRLANPDHLLLPGMFANVSVTAGKPRDAVTVPRTAVTYSLYGDTVYVVAASEGRAADGGKPSLTVQRRLVKVGTVLDDRIVITDGVAAGERVVTSGQNKLRPGAAVRIGESKRLAAPGQRPLQ